MSLVTKPKTSRWLADVMQSPYWIGKLDEKMKVITACEKADTVFDLPAAIVKSIKSAEAEIPEDLRQFSD
jgi:hypothetical protein